MDRPDWGGVARRGAARVDPARGRTSGIQPPRARPEPRDDRIGDRGPEVGQEQASQSEEWILEGVETEARRAVGRGGRSPRRDARDVAGGGEHVGGRGSRSKSDGRARGSFDSSVSPQVAARLDERLDEAARAFERERYGDALKSLKSIVQAAPGVSEARELLGLTYYRLGRWKDAQRELKAFAAATGSTEQHPVLADCARALGRFGDVERYWRELREASPGAELVAEGRIVMAGALADRGRLRDAIHLMEAGRKKVKRPRERHLRMAYVLADLQERAGDLPAARAGFGWLEAQNPDFADVAARLASLR